MAYEIGTAYIQIIPSFDKIERELAKGAKDLADKFGSAAKDAIPAAFVKGVKDGVDVAEDAAEEGGTRSAAAFGDHFETTLKRRMEAAFRALPEVEIDGDSTPVERTIASVRARLEKLRDQEVKVGVNDADILRRVRRLREDLRRLEENAPTIQLKLDAAAARAEADAFLEGIDRRAGAFARKLSEDLKAAISALPAAEVDADVDPAAQKLQTLRRELLRLSELQVGVNITEEKALERLAAVRKALARIAEESDSVELRVNADRAMTVIDGFYDSVVTSAEKTARDAAAAAEKAAEAAAKRAEQKAEAKREREAERAVREAQRDAERAARVAEEAFGRTFAGKIANHLKTALDSLPDFDLAVNPTQAMLWIRIIRENLEELSSKTIGVDIDEREALLQVREIKGALVDLANADPSIQVHADTAAAAAELARIETLATRLDGDKIGIDVKTSGASDVNAIGDAARLSLSRIEALVAGSLSLGTVMVPAAAAAASAVGFIATAAAAAGAGIGTLVLGFSGIGDAVGAMQKLQEDQAQSQASLARSAVQQEAAIDRIASAERALANTRANNAEAARRAARAVADAERGVADARRAAAEAVEDAIERQEDAERSLARAQIDAREAREGLTKAYRDALDAYADLDSAVKRNALSQRQATLDIKEAKEELEKFLLNPRATEEEREQARITYEQRLLQLQDLERQGKQLADQQDEANRKGVEGSDQVVAARQRIADAEERVADAQRAAANAAEAVLKAQVDGSRRISAAERQLADARLAQQAQNRQAAMAVAQAQAAVTSAARQMEQAQTRAGIAGGAALDNLRDALEKLSPKAQQFARFIFGLQDDFRALRNAAADNLLPGVQTSIETLLPYLPAFSRWVGNVAAAVGDLFVETARFLSTDGTWRKFFQHIASSTVPTLQQLYRIGRNVATAVAGMVVALTPFNNDIGGGLERLTERFAKWASALERNPSFERFLAYVRQNGPRVVELIGQLATFVGRFIVAAAPIGALVLEAFTAFVGVLNAIPINILTEVVFVMGLFAAIMLTVSGAQRAFTLVQGTVNTVVERGRDAFQGLGSAVNTLRGHMALAHVQTGQFGTALTHLNAGAGVARRALGGLVSFLGGPWGVAITGAILAAGYFTAKAMEQRQRVQNLTDALTLLGKAYRETKTVSSNAVQDIIAQSDELQNLINRSNEYGIAVEDLARAAAGEADAQQRVIAALEAKKKAHEAEALAFTKDPNERIRRLNEYQKQADGIDTTVAALQRQFTELNNATRAQQLLDEAQARLTASTPKLTTEQFRLNEKLSANAQRIDYLKGLVDVFGNAEATAAQKVDALRRAIEQQTGAKINAIEAEEAHARGVLGLTSTIESNRSSLQAQVDANKLSAAEADKAARSLDTQSDAGLRNRDSLEAAADAVKARYLADIEAGVPMDEATRRHNERIEALIKEADKLYDDEKKTRELIAAYGDIPPEVKTIFTTKGFIDVYKELEMLQVAQHALKYGIDPKDAWAEYNRAKAAAKGQYPQGSGSAGLSPRGDGIGVPVGSTDGRVWGAGTSTSDSNLAWLSNREFVQPAEAVDFYGPGLMEAIRRRQLPKEIFPGFATGGMVKWPFSVTASMTRIPGMDEVRKAVLDQIVGVGKGTGGIGSADMMRLLRAVFPGLPLYSGYRPGSRTPSGNLSYHAMTAADGDKGRAVDLPPRRDVFNWIHDNYFRQTRELIWGGDPSRNIHNGRHHKYSDSLLRSHGPYKGNPGPSPHLHWAYDSGGFLPPGVTTVFNGTGRPEPVFTETQWGEIRALVRNNHAEPRGGETHHWHFAKHDLDIPRLNAWANARDARARPGRPN